MRPTGRTRTLCALALGLMVLVLYSPSLGYPFQFDDQLFLRDDNVRMARWSAFLWPPAPRLLNWLSLTAQFALWGENPFPMRLFNVLLHGLNSALVLLLAFQLQGRLSPTAREGRWKVPVLTGLIFALHPLQTESVVYIYQRSTLLAAFFSLLAVLLWVSRAASSSPTRLSAASLACCLVAFLCKEVALVAPFVLWAWDAYDRDRIRPTPGLTAAIAGSGIAGAAFLWRIAPGGPVGVDLLEQSLTYARTQVTVFWRYLQLFFVPVGQSVDPQVGAVESWISLGWWAQVILLFGLLALVPWTFRRHREFSFWLLCSLLFLAPTSSLMPSPDFMFEHRLYLPLLGLGGAFSALLSRSRTGLRHFGALAALLGLVLGSLSWQRLQVWETPASLWADASRKSPAKYRPAFNYGVALMESSPALAEKSLARAIRLGPELPLAYRSLAQIKWKQGRPREAEQLWQRALSLEPDHVDTLLALGRFHLAEKEFFEAEVYFLRAASIRPTDWQPRYLLAQLYSDFGMTLKALHQAEAGLRYHPGSSVLRVLLADCVRRRANWDRAIELYEQALEDDPESHRAHLGLAEAYASAGRRDLALQAARQAVLYASDASQRTRAMGVLKVLNGRRAE